MQPSAAIPAASSSTSVHRLSSPSQLLPHREAGSAESPLDRSRPTQSRQDIPGDPLPAWSNLHLGSLNGDDETAQGTSTRTVCSQDRSATMPKFLALTAFLASAAFAIGLALFLRHTELDSLYQELTSQCRTKVRAVKSNLATRVFHFTRNLATFAATTPELTTEVFNMFVQKSSYNESITFRVVLLPAFPKEKIPLFEKTYNTTFLNPDPSLVVNDTLVNPVAFSWPNNLPNIRGHNYFADNGTRNELLGCLQSKTWEVTEPTIIIPPDQWGIRVVYPRNRSVTTNSSFSTWIAGVGFQTYQLFPASLASAGLNASFINVRIITAKHQLVYATDHNHTLKNKAVTHVPFLVGSNEWTMQCYALSKFNDEYITFWPWVLCSTLLTMAIILAKGTRRAALEWTNSKRVLFEYEMQERFLATLEHSSQTILELIPDCLLVLDAQGHICAMNSAVSRETGLKDQRLLGKHISQLATIPCELIANHDRRSSQASHTSTPSGAGFYLLESTFEASVTCPSGASFRARFTVSNNPTYGNTEPHPASDENTSLVDTSFAQIVLFHNISQLDDIETVIKAEQQSREASSVMLDLLRLLSMSFFGPTLETQDALNTIGKFDLKHSSKKNNNLRDDVLGSAHANLQEAHRCLQNITNLISDISIFAGVEFHPRLQLQQRLALEELVTQALVPFEHILSSKRVYIRVSASQFKVLAVPAALFYNILTSLFHVTSLLVHVSSEYNIHVRFERARAHLQLLHHVSNLDVAPLMSHDLHSTMSGLDHTLQCSDSLFANAALSYLAFRTLVKRCDGHLARRFLGNGQGCEIELHLPRFNER